MAACRGARGAACLAALLLLTGLAGCHLIFPYSVIAAADAADDATADSRVGDAAAGELARVEAAADAPPPDAPPRPPTKAVSASQILAAWSPLLAKCVDDNGNPAGPDIPVVDSATIAFFPGSTVLAGAPQETVSWVGALSSAAVLFNPNSCGQEDPVSQDYEWGTAGLLIRGASIDGQGRLLLPAGITAAQINLIDMDSVGTFEHEFAKPDDSELPLYPQLVSPIGAVKQAIVGLAQP